MIWKPAVKIQLFKGKVLCEIMKKLVRRNIVLFVMVVFLTLDSVTYVDAAYGIKITNQNTLAVTDLNYENNGKLTCKSGAMTYSYFNGTDYTRRRVEFSANGWTRYKIDANGVKLGKDTTKDEPTYDFQALLNNAKKGKLTIRFYNGTFTLLGPYRIYANTSILSPERNATLKKGKNTYMFINVDDEAAKKVSGAYGGDGNITMQGITFDMNTHGQQIGKFSRAKNINIIDCIFRNGKVGHVFELTSIDTAAIQNCTFQNLVYGLTKDYNGSYDNEVIQIEAFVSPSCSPYCKFNDYRNEYRSKNIRVSDNIFDNVLRGIGNHAGNYNIGSYSSDIKITENQFYNVKEACIRMQGYHNVDISYNTFADTIGQWKSKKTNWDIYVESNTNGRLNIGTNRGIR